MYLKNEIIIIKKKVEFYFNIKNMYFYWHRQFYKTILNESVRSKPVFALEVLLKYLFVWQWVKVYLDKNR